MTPVAFPSKLERAGQQDHNVPELEREGWEQRKAKRR
jgi:hypothetical protein